MVCQRKIGDGIYLNPSVAAMHPLLGTMWLGQRSTTHFYTVPWTGQRGKGGLYISGHSKGLWDLNEDIKSLLFIYINLCINNPFPFHQSLVLRDVFLWW